MEEKRVRCLGVGGSTSTIPTNMTCHVELEAVGTTHPTRPIVHLFALAIMALALLASRSQVKNLGHLARTL